MNREALKRILRGIRNRLLWVSAAFGLGASLTWYFRVEIFDLLLAPAGGQLSVTGRPVFFGPTEMLGVAVGVSVKGGLVTAFPVLLYQVYGLLRNLLSPKIKLFLFWFIPLGFLCYLAGVAFCYFVLLPTGMRYLLQFDTDIATPLINITAYMKMTTTMLFWMGVVFELPPAMLLLSKLGVVSYRKFSRIHGYVYPAAFALGAIITPSFDPVNSTLVAVPLIALYWVGVFLAWLARPKGPRA